MKTKRILGALTLTLVLGLFLWLWLALSYPVQPVPTLAAPMDIPVGQSATCKTWTSRDVPNIIPDNDEITGTVSQIPVAQTGRMSAITVTFTISHEYPGDLKIDLCPPRMSSCLLSWGDLTNTSGVYTVSFSSHPTHADYDDIYDAPPYTGSYPSQTSSDYPPAFPTLLDLIDKQAAGIWQLAVHDEGASDVGSLTAWNITICTISSGPTVTPSPTATLIPITDCVKWYTSDYVFLNGGDFIRNETSGGSYVPSGLGGYWPKYYSQGGATIQYSYDVSARVLTGASNWLKYDGFPCGFTTTPDGSYYWMYSSSTCVSNPIHILGWGSLGAGIGGDTNKCTYASVDLEIKVLSCDQRTPQPTYTPVCATPTPRNFGWWWQW